MLYYSPRKRSTAEAEGEGHSGFRNRELYEPGHAEPSAQLVVLACAWGVRW
jgi:hypothetical protein